MTLLNLPTVPPPPLVENTWDDVILSTAEKLGLPIVEDATESLGSRYKGRHTGTLGDLGCFSFNGNKLITTGGGGMLVTNDPEIALRARYLTTQAKDDPLEYIHNEVGYNYRLTTRRLWVTRGIWQMVASALELSCVASVRVERTWLERRLGVGRVCVTPEGNGWPLVLEGVRHPRDAAETIRAAVKAARGADER